MSKVKRANIAFARMSKKQQRVTIAKDVIAWLSSGKLKAQRGVYFDPEGVVEGQAVPTEADKMEKCTACALGAVFACTAVRATLPVTCNFYDGYTNFTPEYAFANSETMTDDLTPYFTKDELHNIENAFEAKRGSAIYGQEDFSAGKFDEAALTFNKGVRSSKERMKRIMKNIIRNDGKFVPGKEKRA